MRCQRHRAAPHAARSVTGVTQPLHLAAAVTPTRAGHPPAAGLDARARFSLTA